MMVSCQTGHLATSMLLSSYGATRQRTVFLGCIPTSESWAYDLAKRSGNEELVRWLEASLQYTTPLHHIEVLTPKRTVALLRSGRFSPLAGDQVTPATRAVEHPDSAAAAYILKACEPWTPNFNKLWGAPLRARAYELLKIGYQLRLIHGDALLDTWVAHVMPYAITWDEQEHDDGDSSKCDEEEMEVDLCRGACGGSATE